MVSQDRMLVERYRRQNERQWLYEAISSAEVELTIESAGCSIALSEIYAKVELA